MKAIKAKCLDCGTEDEAEFYKGRNGYMGKTRCRRCQNIMSKDEYHTRGRGHQRKTNKAVRMKMLEYWRNYRAANKKRFAEYSKRYRLKNLEQVRYWNRIRSKNPKGIARRILNKAVADGIIIRPTSCSKCNQCFPSNEIHGHHADYTKPLEVQWLCISCHGKEHRSNA